MDTKVKLLAIIAVLNILFSIFLVRDSRSLLRVLFSLVVLFVGLWSLSLGFFINTTNLDTALLASIFYYLCAAAIPLLFFYFSVVFVNNKSTLSLKYLVYLLPFFYFSISFLLDHNFIIKDIHYIEGTTIKDVVLDSRHYVYYSIYFLFYVSISYVVLLRATASKELSGIQKKQLKIIILGTLASYLLAIVPNLLLPYFGNYQLVWLGPLFTILMVFSIAYAILKHHLFNIKLILVELAILLLNMFLLFNVFTSQSTVSFVLNISISAFVLIFSIFLLRGIYKDIRDRERIEELAKEMAVTNEKLHILEQQKTEFVSIASHQLRTPLTVIKGYASMILEGTFGTIADPVKDAIGKLYKSSDRIVALVEDLLTVSRLEQGRGALHLETVDLVRVVQMVTMEMDEDIKRSSLDFSFTVEEGGEFPVSIDEKKFKQVVRHILDNAIEYTNAPGRVRIAINEDNIADKIRLTVSDTGVGMTAEQIKTIFERFNLKINSEARTGAEGEQGVQGGQLTQPSLWPSHESADSQLTTDKGQLTGEVGQLTTDTASRTSDGEKQTTDDKQRTKEKEGAETEMPNQRTPGIGLYIAQEILEAHHGTLHIASAGMNEGTTVIVEMPRGDGKK